tara:strand:+ start:1082 stop:1471 length:390 start_codon:yes stop_codon:yes gene_type:complete
MKKKKILLDMSATILHHGHIRLIKKASKYGKVVIGLTKDAQIKKFKGYTPEISFKHRKEILENIRGVYKVIPSNFYINNKFLSKNKIDLLCHGDDNLNDIDKEKIIIFKRTNNISSSLIRMKAARNLKK